MAINASSEAERRRPTADSESGYKVGRAGRRCAPASGKGQSGNPGGRSTKSLPALLADALDETVAVTSTDAANSTKREAIVAQTVDKSASADLRATKMLLDMMKDVEQREFGGSGEAAAARPLPISFDPTHNRNPPSRAGSLARRPRIRERRSGKFTPFQRLVGCLRLELPPYGTCHLTNLT